MRFTEDYKAAFEQAVSNLIENRIVDIEERKKAVEDLIEEYIADTGERPDPYQLDRLASLLLYEYLEGDRSKDKILNSEYPILTEDQFKRRYRRELGEGSLKTIATDLKDYRPVTGRTLSVYEMITIDLEAAKGNSERARRVRASRKPSKVTTYYLQN